MQALFDAEALLEDFAGDEEILRAAVETFLREDEALLAELKAALHAGEIKAIEATAHKFKGAVANFRAEPVVEALLAVEKAARRGAAPGPDAYPPVAGLVGILASQLEAFLHLPQLCQGRLSEAN
jgi:HPt (histidine-containing phosphotransfer) domain-containing protein